MIYKRVTVKEGKAYTSHENEFIPCLVKQEVEDGEYHMIMNIVDGEDEQGKPKAVFVPQMEGQYLVLLPITEIINQ